MQSYRTILADPPWPYKQHLGRGIKEGDTTRGGLPYSDMTIEKISALKVGNIAHSDSMCWLWTTNSHLHEAHHVLASWGFEYKTMVTWAKTGFGLGYWLRGQTEHLLLGIKGNPRSKMIGPSGATGKAWSTLITAKRGEHSEKPQVVFDMIDDMCEDPKIELFSRKLRLGWDCWGLEASNLDLLL